MRILAALALLVSVNAYACPDLTGTYTCKYQDNTTEVVSISQENKDGVMVYNYNGSALPADNQVYQIPDQDSLKQGTFRAWCDEADATVLQTELLGKYYDQGQFAGDLTLDMAFSLNGTDLRQLTTGKLVNSDGEYPIGTDVTCTRN
jgi:hypothetical protein